MLEEVASDQAKDNTKRDLETLAMTVGESVRAYVARSKEPANEVKYQVEVTDDEICRRV